jgi:preprotein translocase subunit SecA
MLKKIFSILGESNDKAVNRLVPQVADINACEDDLKSKDVREFLALSSNLKHRAQQGEALDSLLPEAFALVREVALRTLNQRHFDVQLMGGVVLNRGAIAEMRTGEGKTLVATLAAYLNSLSGKGVHIVTVNDYLAKRDAEWMGRVYTSLGLTVGCIQHDISHLISASEDDFELDTLNVEEVSRREAYLADITYGTNNEFGFDYLRDNMVLDVKDRVQRELHYAIVDEVDNILIDEARTPLIISGIAQDSSEMNRNFARIASRMLDGEGVDFIVDEKLRSVSLTETGARKIEEFLNIQNLYDPENYVMSHYAENAIRAVVTYQKDRDYVVRDGQVIIVDEFTGRLMEGRRYGEGLHQAIEAKEGVKIQPESMTYATITLQNYFRMYGKLAGMTGTAVTEAEEFLKIYGLEVISVPTNKPTLREDFPDLIFKTEQAKVRAVVDDVFDTTALGRPVLVGTASIEKSEEIGSALNKRGVKHNVLNAKNHQREALIIAQAGEPGAVTVATNMAGRGTDISLGGDPSSVDNSDWQEKHDRIVDLGGLHVIGTERHEARRIDNQLRGRSARQGDPGSTRFYISVADDLMRRFGGDRIKSVLEWAGVDEDEPIESKLVTKQIENAQVKVEGHNFDMRKHLVEYDDVVNRQRSLIYSDRTDILHNIELMGRYKSQLRDEVSAITSRLLSSHQSDEWDCLTLIEEVNLLFPKSKKIELKDIGPLIDRNDVDRFLIDYADDAVQLLRERLGEEMVSDLVRQLSLRALDTNWVQHLTSLENLRMGIGLHAYGQRDPLVMFKKESHEMFEALLERIQYETVRTIPQLGEAISEDSRSYRLNSPIMPRASLAQANTVRRSGGQQIGRVGRNDQCPCGSGKKYKRCHGG